MIDPRYGRLLTGTDLDFLHTAAGGPPPQQLQADPSSTDALLRGPAVYEALFGSVEKDPLLQASPFLVFSVLINKVATDLQGAAFVEEWLGSNRTVPVFDVASLRQFLDTSWHRAFLAELLASYTRVASGSVWQRTARGWRRRRYSELDPVRLTQLLEVVPVAQRPAVCRRVGDLALFLSGVFPEHAAAHPLQPRHIERISRLLDASGLAAGSPGISALPEEVLRAGGPQQGIWLLEWLGRRAYRLAIPAAGTSAEDLREVVKEFGRGRRVLNVLTRQYLYPSRERWFPSAG